MALDVKNLKFSVKIHLKLQWVPSFTSSSSSRPEVFCKNASQKNFGNFTFMAEYYCSKITGYDFTTLRLHHGYVPVNLNRNTRENLLL